MKPANLARPAALLLAGLAACTPEATPPVAPPPTVSIATAAPPEPPPPEPAPLPAKAAVAEPAGEDLDAVRDERPHRARLRGASLLVTQAQGLEALLAATPKGAMDRPALLRRIAETYATMAWAAAREHSGSGYKVTEAASRRTITSYEALWTEYPQYCIAPNLSDPARSTGCADEVLYYLGLAAEQAGQLDRARKAYLDLLQRFPSSRYVPGAYLAFGEMFLREGKDDPTKLSLAEQSYSQVLKYPPPDNHVSGYAHYQLGRVYALKGDDTRALSQFVKAVGGAAQGPDTGALGAAARRELVVVYARVGERAQARAFFSRVAPGPKELEEMLQALDALPVTAGGAPKPPAP